MTNTNTNTDIPLSFMDKLIFFWAFILYVTMFYFRMWTDWSEPKYVVLILTPQIFVLALLLGIDWAKTWVQRLFILPFALLFAFLTLLSGLKW